MTLPGQYLTSIGRIVVAEKLQNRLDRYLWGDGGVCESAFRGKKVDLVCEPRHRKRVLQSLKCSDSRYRYRFQVRPETRWRFPNQREEPFQSKYAHRQDRRLWNIRYKRCSFLTPERFLLARL